MLRWAFIFLVIGLLAGLLGFTGVAAAVGGIAKILFFLFLALFALFLLLGSLVSAKIRKRAETPRLPLPPPSASP